MPKKRKKKAGRKCLLNKERFEKIIKLIEIGNYAKTACMATGISEVTYYKWINWGKEKIKKGQHSNKFAKFVKSIKIARAKAEARYVTIISKEALNDWKAAMTWLERTNPSQWGRREKYEVEHSEKPTLDEFKEWYKNLDISEYIKFGEDEEDKDADKRE